MGQGQPVTASLPPLPPGATLNAPTPAPSASALPPLPAGATLNTPSAAPQPEQKPHWYDAIVNHTGELIPETGQVLEGVKKGINETGATAMRALSATPFIGAGLKATPGWNQSQQQTQQIADAPNDTAGKTAGYAIENIIEFAAGDELLKGLSVGQKLTKLAPLVKYLEKFPKLAEALHAGIQQGTVSTAQALAHGASAGDALKEGAIGGVTGGAVEGVAQGVTKLVEHVRPREMNIDGVKFPILRSQEANPSSLQDFAAKPNDRGTARVQNAAGQQVIENAAKKAVDTNLGEVNKHLASETPEEAYMRKRFGAGTPEEQEAAQAAKQIDAPAAVKRTRNFVDAADELKTSAQGIDERLGAATDGKYKDLHRDLRDAEQNAYSAGDEGREAAEKQVDAIRDRLDNYFTASGDTNTGDIAARNQAWHKQYILRDAGNALESSFNLTPQTAAEIRVNRFFDPKKAQARLTRIERKVDGKYGKGYFAQTLGPEALKNMHTVFHYMAESPSNAANANRGINLIAKVLAGESLAGAALHTFGHGIAASTGLAGTGIAVTLAAKKTLHAIATNPKIAQQFIYAMKYARPKVAAPLIAQMIRENDQEERQANK